MADEVQTLRILSARELEQRLRVVAHATGCRGVRERNRTQIAGRLDSLEVENVALVRMVHAAPGIGDVAVSSEDQQMFSSVGFKEITDYRKLEQILARFRLVAGTNDTTVITNLEILLDGSRYTLFAMPDDKNGVQLRVLRDELMPDSGMARIRLVHALHGADKVDVGIEGQEDVLFDDIEFGLEAGFRDIAPAAVTLVVRASEGDSRLHRFPIEIEVGHAYTIVLTRTNRGAVEVITVDDSTNAK